MNKDKKLANAQQLPSPAAPTSGAAAQQPQPMSATDSTPMAATAVQLPKMAVPMEEGPRKQLLAQEELMPTLRPPAGSFSGGSMDGGDSDSEEHLQVCSLNLKKRANK